MFLSDWRRRLRRSATSLPGSVSHAEVRPSLEHLEDRVAPTNMSFSVSPATFGLFKQTETVTVHVTDNSGNPVGNLGGTQQTVSITDGGQTHTGVSVNSHGDATTTFTFNLLQEFQNKTYGSHPVSASYNPTGVDQFNVPYSTFASAFTGNGTAPGNTTGFFFQLALDFSLVSAISGGNGGNG
jgi:hypothetical protein